jgi:hypothetical protein
MTGPGLLHGPEFMAKIAFITGCLEPGRDGVGDYAAALGAECVRQGHSVCAVALNDGQTVEQWRGGRQGVQVLRIPASAPVGERMREAARFFGEQQPDCASLQFVSYAYAPRGLVFGLARRLRPLFAGRKVHIMFHELWIGRDAGEPLKNRLTGRCQRLLIQSLARRLRPGAAHTSNQYYVEELRKAGIPARVLPLFGNLDLSLTPETDWFYERAVAAGWPLRQETRDQFLLFGFFGSIHPVWRPEPLFARLEQAGKRLGRRLGFVSVGRDPAGAALWETLEKTYGGRHLFMRAGEQPAARIAGYFRLMDYGLATTPYALIGKSGTTVAMVESGLPVIVSREDVFFDGPQPELDDIKPLLLRLTDDLGSRLGNQPRGAAPGSRLPAVARRFLQDLGLKTAVVAA